MAYLGLRGGFPDGTRKYLSTNSASASVKRPTAVKARYLALSGGRGPDFDNFVCGPAIGAIEQYGLVCGHAGKCGIM